MVFSKVLYVFLYQREEEFKNVLIYFLVNFLFLKFSCWDDVVLVKIILNVFIVMKFKGINIDQNVEFEI